MSSDISLSDDHELQVQGYLRFAKMKRDQHVRGVVADMEDFKNDRVNEGDMYTAKEVASMLNDLKAQVKDDMGKEMENAYHTNALLVRLLLVQAQCFGMELAVDTTQLENEFLLKQIKSSETTALSRPASDFVKKNNQLNKIGTVGTIAVQDPKLVKERDQLKSELATLKDRFNKLQEQTTKMMREKTDLAGQLSTLKEDLTGKESALKSVKDSSSSTISKLQKELQALSAGAAQLSAAQIAEIQKQLKTLVGEVDKLKSDLSSTKEQLAIKEKDLRVAEEGLNGKLQDCKQFLQMKKLMKEKSNEVVTLRKRLGKYEPQSIPDAEGTAAVKPTSSSSSSKSRA